MIRRFKTLRLIGKRHRIEWDATDLSDDNEYVDGVFEQQKKLIRIAAGQTHDDERETLIHEMLHALEVQMNAEIPEPKLRQLAVGLYAALKDNPRLVGYLLEEEEDDVELAGGDQGRGGNLRGSGGGDHGDVVRDT
jgi:hypothetical protein